MVDKNIYIVQGEISTVVGAIKRNSRWNTHTPLVSSTQLDLLTICDQRERDELQLGCMSVYSQSAWFLFRAKQ